MGDEVVVTTEGEEPTKHTAESTETTALAHEAGANSVRMEQAATETAEAKATAEEAKANAAAAVEAASSPHGHEELASKEDLKSAEDRIASAIERGFSAGKETVTHPVKKAEEEVQEPPKSREGNVKKKRSFGDRWYGR